MKLVVENMVTRVVDATIEERGWLKDYLVFNERKFNPWKRQFELKTQQFYNDNAGTFPGGYTRIVHSVGKELGYVVDVEDARRVPCKPDPAADLEWLRHHPAANVDPITHQLEAVQAVWKRTRGVIKVPTGGGKTEIACGIAKSLKCNWLFLVHRGDLLQQTADRFEARCPGEEAGVIGDSRWSEGRFTVAMFQTVYARLKAGDPAMLEFLDSVEGVIVDECHTAAADTFWAVIMALPNAYFRVGLSATPLKHGTGRGTFVIAALGPLIYEVRAKLLQEIGVLSRPSIRFITVKQTAVRPTWQGVYSENIIKSKVRNAVLLDVARRAKKPCLLFVQQLSHGTLLHKMLTKAGIATENISGKETVPQRKAAIERLVRADIEVLICNVIFQEGVDIPSLASVVIGTGGASAIAALQRVGRGMRATKTKSTFEVWEIADKGCGCNKKTKENDRDNWHAGCQWLNRHTRERLNAYEGEEYEVEVEDADVFL